MKDPRAHLLNIVLIPLLLLSISGCSTGPVVKMPDSLPSSIKSYKHFTLWGGNPGMKGTGVQLNKGDTYTVLATGSIDYCRGGGCNYRDVRPEQGWPLVARIGQGPHFNILPKDRGGVTQHVLSQHTFDSGELYLGYRQGELLPSGEERWEVNGP